MLWSWYIIRVTLGPLYRFRPLPPPALPGLPMASYATGSWSPCAAGISTVWTPGCALCEYVSDASGSSFTGRRLVGTWRGGMSVLTLRRACRVTPVTQPRPCRCWRSVTATVAPAAARLRRQSGRDDAGRPGNRRRNATRRTCWPANSAACVHNTDAHTDIRPISEPPITHKKS